MRHLQSDALIQLSYKGEISDSFESVCGILSTHGWVVEKMKGTTGFGLEVGGMEHV